MFPAWTEPELRGTTNTSQKLRYEMNDNEICEETFNIKKSEKKWSETCKYVFVGVSPHQQKWQL